MNKQRENPDVAKFNVRMPADVHAGMWKLKESMEARDHRPVSLNWLFVKAARDLLAKRGIELCSIAPQDRARLRTLGERVRETVAGGSQFKDVNDSCWWTLGELVDYVGGSATGVSARLRELRRTSASTGRMYQHVGDCPDPYLVERRRRGDSALFEYRVSLPEKSAQREMF